MFVAMDVDFSEYWFFEKFDVLDALTHDEKVDVTKMSCRTKYAKKQFIYKTGDRAKRLHFLKSGTIKVSKYSEDGKEMIISILRQGDVFGEASIIYGPNGVHQEVVEVMDDALTCSLSIQDVNRLLVKNLKFSQSITNLIGDKYKKMQQRLESLFFKSTPERIKGFIKEMADDCGNKLLNGIEIEVKLNLKHEDIAKLTGTTRQTVTSIMSDLEKEGIISYDRSRVLIKDYNALS